MSWKTNKDTGKRFQSKGNGVDPSEIDRLYGTDENRVVFDKDPIGTAMAGEDLEGLEEQLSFQQVHFESVESDYNYTKEYIRRLKREIRKRKRAGEIS